MPISSRIGPLTTAIVAKDVVELERAVMPLAVAARITGRYSGRAPAMTALTATFSTVNSQNSRKMSATASPRSSGDVVMWLWVTTRSHSPMTRLMSTWSCGNCVV
jgi:hypothetical protein